MELESKEKKKLSYNHAFNVADEYYTPTSLVRIIIPDLKEWERLFIKLHGRKPIIWCPFDEETSKYVKELRKEGFEVLYSHLNLDQDFFTYEPENWDIAVSNPPFSQKVRIFERLYNFGKPFVMLMNMMAINYQIVGNLFYKIGTDIQFLVPDKKVSFDGNTSSFNSGYVCYRFIDKTKFVHMDNNNTKGNFRK